MSDFLEKTDTAKNTEAPQENTGTILAKLRKQVEAGITLNSDGIKVKNSLDECLFPESSDTIKNNTICANTPIRDKNEFGIRPHRVDFYNELVEFHQVNYKDNASVRLIRQDGELLVVTEHMVGENLKVTQILDAEFPETEKYKKYMEEIMERINSNKYFTGDDKEPYGIAKKVIIQDLKSQKAFDLKSLLPDDWEMRYYPRLGNVNFSQDTDVKHLSYGELSTPNHFAALLHEYGHCVKDAQNLEEYREVKDLWENSRFQIGGAKNLDPAIYAKTKKLLVKNERGASARALEVVRILHEQGLKTGITAMEVGKYLTDALKNYEKGYPSEEVKFTRHKLE